MVGSGSLDSNTPHLILPPTVNIARLMGFYIRGNPLKTDPEMKSREP